MILLKLSLLLPLNQMLFEDILTESDGLALKRPLSKKVIESNHSLPGKGAE